MISPRRARLARLFPPSVLGGTLIALMAIAPIPVAANPAQGPAVAGVPTGVHLLLIGLDGADWQIADPLIKAGKLPNLARLRSEGAWADLKSAVPTLSPLLWTSIATGKTPDQHGIIDFLVVDPRTGRKVPIASTFRKTRALWNIFSEAGRTVDFIGWWATWPAESVKGHIVSDRLAYSLFGYRSRPEDQVGLVSPPSLLDAIGPLRVSEDAITLDDLRRFAPFTKAELEAARAKVVADPDQAYSDPLNHLVRILASTRTYHAIALKLLREDHPDLLSVYFQGIDEVCHRFAQYIPPRPSWVDSAEYAKYHDVVTRFYEYQDGLIGELLEAAGPDTTVIVTSDHGFLNGSDRPDFPPDVETKAGKWHRLYGVYLMKGPHVTPGRIDPVSIYDLAPTLLYLSGLPVPADMKGRAVLDPIDAAFQRRYPLTTVATYETTPRAPASDLATVPGSSAEIDEEILAKLKSLGYISSTDIAVDAAPSGADAPATLTNLFNTATLQLAAGDVAGSEKAARAILERVPDHAESHALLSEILEAKGDDEEALREARTALNLMKEPSERVVNQFCQLSRRLSRLDEAKTFFLRYAQLRPGRGEPWLGLGTAQSMSGDLKAAESSFLRALDLSPRSRGAATGLFNLYDKGQRSKEIQASIEKAVSVNPDSSAPHSLLGMIYSRQGQFQKAEQQLRKALELEPESDMATAALGDLMVNTGRVEQARQLLEKAVARDSDQAEVRMALGRVYAKMRRLGEATREMEEAVRIDPTSASAQAQLAIILLMQEQTQRAIPHAEEALRIDPELYELHLHLAVAYHGLKRMKECETHLLEAVRARPEDPEPHRLLASLYDETGRPGEAAKERARLKEITSGR